MRLSEYFKQPLSPPEVDGLLRAAGVQHVSCTLMPGRCGSTFLAGLAESYGFGTGRENFNELPAEAFATVAPTGDLKQYLSHILHHNVKNGIFYFQATPLRATNLFSICPLNRSELSFGYTLLLRRNVVAQAISYVNALGTGVWHSYASEDPRRQRPKPIPAPLYRGLEPVDWWIRAILKTEIDALTVMGPSRAPSAPTLYYEDLSAASLETFVHFLRINGQEPDSARLGAAFAGPSLTQRAPRADYIASYLEAVAGRGDLLALLERRAEVGFDKSSNAAFLEQFQGRIAQ